MTEVLVASAVVILLVIVNGLFVAAEFAIVGAPRASIEARADKGDRRARRVQRILEDSRSQDRFIANLLVCQVPQRDADPRQQLAEAKRLGQIVIGTCIKRRNLILIALTD